MRHTQKTERNKSIIKMMQQGATFKKTGAAFSVSGERVRQIWFKNRRLNRILTHNCVCSDKDIINNIHSVHNRTKYVCQLCLKKYHTMTPDK